MGMTYAERAKKTLPAALFQAAWIGYWVMDATGWQGVATVAEVAKITLASTGLRFTAFFLAVNAAIIITCVIAAGVEEYMASELEKKESEQKDVKQKDAEPAITP